MLEPLRLVTIHPALVHFTLGTLPLIVIAYGAAAWRSSSDWTFVGDVAVMVTALITLFTFAFGLISNAIVHWPVDLDLWRWLHLALGATSMLFLIGFATKRWVARRLRTYSGPGAFFGAIFAALLLGGTGWIGGEVLVFHSGLGVMGAAGGALSPRASNDPRSPRNLTEAMGLIRASWASATTRIARMVVEAPIPADFERAAEDARRLRALSEWVAHKGSLTRDEHLTLMASQLASSAGGLEAAAQSRSLVNLFRAASAVDVECAACHDELRWRRRP